jgi:hypothetical protein
MLTTKLSLTGCSSTEGNIGLHLGFSIQLFWGVGCGKGGVQLGKFVEIVQVQLGYSRVCVCVCMVCTKMYEGSSQKLMFGGALSLFLSFKGVANRFSESMVTL